MWQNGPYNNQPVPPVISPPFPGRFPAVSPPFPRRFPVVSMGVLFNCFMATDRAVNDKQSVEKRGRERENGSPYSELGTRDSGALGGIAG